LAPWRGQGSRSILVEMMSFRAAAVWSLIYLAAALMFGVALGLIAGWDIGTQFLAGYVVERSLSVDNLFVFVIIMSTFAVPPEYQSRALGIGIALALVLRAIFIAAGSILLATFSFMFLIFGIGLIATAVHLFRHRDEDPSVSNNAVVALARRRLPLTDRYHGNRIVTRVNRRRMLTPLAIALVAIATTDFLFALDSIPAVYGITTNAYLVLAANVFALLGLRALYFLVSGLLDRLVYLSTGLAAILAFIGVKLVFHFAHLQHDSIPGISTGASLAVIVTVLALTTVASLARTRQRYTLGPMAPPGSELDPGGDAHTEPDPNVGKPPTVGTRRRPGGARGRDGRDPRWTARSRARAPHRRIDTRTLDVRAGRGDGVPRDRRRHRPDRTGRAGGDPRRRRRRPG
jgi:tellurite resistance protein TerC